MRTPLSASREARFSPRERRLIARLRTPLAVQRYLNRLPYNTEPAPGGATLRSFRGVVRLGAAHCLEAALFAAVLLEQHGYPPLVLSFESIDELDHVIFLYRSRGGWGSVARSRDPGLHGRLPVFPTPRALALSYVEPYVDYTGRVTGYAVVNVAEEMGDYDWRLAEIVSDRHVGGAKIVLGDFNEWMRGATTQLLSGRLKSVDLTNYLKRRRTYPGLFPLLHLDHIYYAGRMDIVGIELPRTRLSLVASDHLPLVADVRVG